LTFSTLQGLAHREWLLANQHESSLKNGPADQIERDEGEQEEESCRSQQKPEVAGSLHRDKYQIANIVYSDQVQIRGWIDEQQSGGDGTVKWKLGDF
jgi:hypothetical protein